MSERTRADELAEQIAVLYGWCPAHEDTDHDKALSMIWKQWFDEVGGQKFVRPRAHPELSRERIAVLARQYNERRAATMAKIDNLMEVRR